MGLIKSRKFDGNICRHNGFLHKYSNDRLFYHYTQQVRPIVKMNKVEFKDQILTLKKELYEDSNLTICYDSNITSRKLEDLGFNIYSLKKFSDKFYGYKDNLESENMASDLFLFIKEVLCCEEEFSKKYVVKCDIIGYRKEYFCPICGEKFSLYSRHFLELENVCSTHLFDDEHKIASASFYELFNFSVKQNLDDDEIIKETKYRADFLRMKKKMVFNKDTLCIYSINGLQRIGSEKLKAKNPYSIKNEVYNSHSRRNYLSECKDFYLSVYKFLLNNYEKDLEYIFKDLKLLTKRDNFMVYNIDEVENIEQLKQWIDNQINDNRTDDFYYVNLSEVLSLMYKILYVKKKYNVNNTSLAIYCLTLRKVRPDILGKIKHLKDKDKLKALKINNKEIMEYMLDIHPAFFPLSLLLFGQLKDINNVKKLLQCNFLFTYAEENYRKFISLTKEFLRKYKKGKDETVFTNRLTKDYRFLVDIVNMYEDLLKEVENYEVDFSLSLKEIHDILSLDHRKIGTENKNIPQNRDLKKIFKNASFNDINYKLAKDTYELIDVGSKMNICVGSYGNRAVEKVCYIVVGYNKQNEPVTCMELTKKEGIFQIEQVKKYRNNFAELDEQLYLIDLCFSNLIHIPKDCYDLSNGIKLIKEKEVC